MLSISRSVQQQNLNTAFSNKSNPSNSHYTQHGKLNSLQLQAARFPFYLHNENFMAHLLWHISNVTDLNFFRCCRDGDGFVKNWCLADQTGGRIEQLLQHNKSCRLRDECPQHPQHGEVAVDGLWGSPIESAEAQEQFVACLGSPLDLRPRSESHNLVEPCDGPGSEVGALLCLVGLLVFHNLVPNKLLLLFSHRWSPAVPSRLRWIDSDPRLRSR